METEKEEKVAVAREAEERWAWRVEEARRRAYLQGHGVPMREKGSLYGERPEMRRPYCYEGTKKKNTLLKITTPSYPVRGRLNH